MYNCSKTKVCVPNYRYQGTTILFVLSPWQVVFDAGCVEIWKSLMWFFVLPYTGPVKILRNFVAWIDSTHALKKAKRCIVTYY